MDDDDIGDELTFDFFFDQYRSCISLSQKALTRNDAHESLLQMITDCVYPFKFNDAIVELMFVNVLKQPDVEPSHCKLFFGFAEKYALNLLHQPWKKEIRNIKQHTGVFKNIFSKFCPDITSYLSELGYKLDIESIEYKLTRRISREQLISSAYNCFIALGKLEYFITIYDELHHFGYSWFQLMMTMIAGKIPVKLKSEMIDWIHDNVMPEKIVNVKRLNAAQRELDDITDEDLYGHSNSEPVTVDDSLEFATFDEHMNRSYDLLNEKTSKKSHSQLRRPSNDSCLSKFSSIDSARYDIDRKYPESEQESDLSLTIDIKHPPRINDEIYADLPHIRDSLNTKSGKRNGSRDHKNKVLPPSHMSDKANMKLTSQYRESLATRKVNSNLNLSTERLKANSSTEINQKKYSSATSNSRPDRRNVLSDIVSDQTREDFKPLSFSRSQSHDLSLSLLSTRNESTKARLGLSSKVETSTSDSNLTKYRTEKWACEFCTVKNDPVTCICSICHKVRHGLSSKVETSIHEGNLMKYRTEKWECKFCTVKNDPMTYICSTCSKSRYSGAECSRLISGSHPCDYCTYINDERRDNCKECGTKLSKSTTYI